MEQQDELERINVARRRVARRNEQEVFVMAGIDDDDDEDAQNPKRNRKDRLDITHKFFLGIFLRVYVPVEHVWYVYRNGAFYKRLGTGSHILWNRGIFFTKWQVRRINLQTVILPTYVDGRVKGPALSSGDGERVISELALDVIAEFRLLARLVDIEKFLKYELPIKVFYSSFNNLVQELIGTLPYDQFGTWATHLRYRLEEELQRGRDNTEDLIGIKIEKVFVDSVESNDDHDQQVLEMYKLLEKAKRDLETTISAGKQAEMLGLPPSILALQDSKLGNDLLRYDANLRELMVKAGFWGQGAAQPLPPTRVTQDSSPPSIYFPARQPQPQLPSYGNSGSYPSLPHSVTGNIIVPPPSSSSTVGPAPSKSPFTQERQALELEKLKEAGFYTSGWGAQGSRFDEQGKPIEGSLERSIGVFVQRDDGEYITIVFYCTEQYPVAAPRADVRMPGSSQLRARKPNTIVRWNPGRLLVEVVREIADEAALIE